MRYRESIGVRKGCKFNWKGNGYIGMEADKRINRVNKSEGSRLLMLIIHDFILN